MPSSTHARCAPDDLRAVHIAVDPDTAEDLADDWANIGLDRFPLELVECPDRRLNRAALELVAEAAADGETEVTVLVPQRQYRRLWHRLLHDRTSDSMAAHPVRAAARQRHIRALSPRVLTRRETHRSSEHRRRLVTDLLSPETMPIRDVRWRDRVRVAGRVRSMRVQPWSGVPSLECTIVDDTGGLTLVFLGRSSIGGIRLGTRLVAEGMISESRARLVILNPVYELLPHEDHAA